VADVATTQEVTASEQQTEQVSSSNVEETKLGEEIIASINQDTAVNTETQNGEPSTTPTENVGDVKQVETGTVDTIFSELEAPKKEGFWQGVVNVINYFTAEGKTKKEITNLMADQIKVLANNEKNKSKFVRNFKKSKIHELYQTVNKIASTMNVPGWEIATA
jgi:hypothetical protein